MRAPSAERAVDEARALAGQGFAVLPVTPDIEDSQVMQGPWISAAEE